MTLENSVSSVTVPTLILGLGETGLAAAQWCRRAGVPVRVADTRREPPLLPQAQESLGSGVAYHLGLSVFPESLLSGVDRVVLSPGLAPHDPALAPLLAAAAAQAIPVLGEIELFAQALQQLAGQQGYKPSVLAITGTNGKTTVTALTAHLLRAAGWHAQAAGNIGPAALHALVLALEADDLPQVWVLELSSFQLETVTSLAPEAAVVLNVSEDHLDWHGSMAAYAAAKSRLLQLAKVAIVNRDDPIVRGMVPGLAARQVRSFGSDAPVLAGDLGLDASTGLVWLAEAAAAGFAAEPAPKRRKGEPEPGRAEGRLNRLMPADALLLRGTHNQLNAQAAFLLARSLGVSWPDLLRSVREYRGEPHRVAWLCTIDEVDYVDDSKGTNVGATLAALQGLGRRVVLIAGGDGKGQDFGPLAPAVAQHARAVVLIGRDAVRLHDALASTGVACEHADSLPTAVVRAAALARPGDTVLLSPACASLDMFRNYVERAEVFAQAVQALASDRGVS